MTSQNSSEFLFASINVDHPDHTESSDALKLETVSGNKHKLEIKSEPNALEPDTTEFASSQPQRKRIRLDNEHETDPKLETQVSQHTDNTATVSTSNTNSKIGPAKRRMFTFEPPDHKEWNTGSRAHHNQSSHNGNHYGVCGQPPCLLPVLSHPSPQYFVPIVPHHPHLSHSPYYPHAHPSPYGYPAAPHAHYVPHYNAYSHALSAAAAADHAKHSVSKRGSSGKKRVYSRANRIKTDELDSDDVDEVHKNERGNDKENNNNNNNNSNKDGNRMDSDNNSNSQLHEDDIIGDDSSHNANKTRINGVLTDKSPFKTTYISEEEELELKTTNCTLYSQFHHARQAIYQQYQQKVDAIRHSNMLSAEKRKLNIKVAAIDAKVQEKKLFLSYLEMSKPQPNSWLISNSALSMNGFARKITNQQQTPSLYTSANHQNKNNTDNNNNHNDAARSNSSVKQEGPSSTDTSNNNVDNTSTTTATTTTKKTMIAKRVKKPKFSEYNVRVLRDWYETHTNNPYPSSSEKHLMCQLTGLTKYQVSRWFCNVRTRKPPPELSDNDEDIMGKTSSSPPPPPPPPPPPMHSHTNHDTMNGAHAAYNGYATGPAPPALQHPLTPISPYNLPLPITPNPHHPFGFTPMNINLPPITPISTTGKANAPHRGNAQQQQQQQQQQAENMIDCSDQSEGLMPAINSSFNHQAPLNPPPLIDENSNHMVTSANDK